MWSTAAAAPSAVLCSRNAIFEVGSHHTRGSKSRSAFWQLTCHCAYTAVFGPTLRNPLSTTVLRAIGPAVSPAPQDGASEPHHQPFGWPGAGSDTEPPDRLVPPMSMTSRLQPVSSARVRQRQSPSLLALVTPARGIVALPTVADSPETVVPLPPGAGVLPAPADGLGAPPAWVVAFAAGVPWPGIWPPPQPATASATVAVAAARRT